MILELKYVDTEVMVLFKVGVSCYAAVLSDAKLKGFSNMSMSAKLSLMSLSRVIASVGIAAVMEPGVQPSYNPSAAGFFDHWTLATWIVTLSFTSKSLITLYLLKSLDGIQKNVGEAGTSKIFEHRTVEGLRVNGIYVSLFFLICNCRFFVRRA